MPPTTWQLFPNIVQYDVIMLRSIWWRSCWKVCHGTHLFLRDSELAECLELIMQAAEMVEIWAHPSEAVRRTQDAWAGDFSLRSMGFPFVWSAANMHIQIQEAWFDWNRMIVSGRFGWEGDNEILKCLLKSISLKSPGSPVIYIYV